METNLLGFEARALATLADQNDQPFALFKKNDGSQEGAFASERMVAMSTTCTGSKYPKQKEDLV